MTSVWLPRWCFLGCGPVTNVCLSQVIILVYFFVQWSYVAINICVAYGAFIWPYNIVIYIKKNIQLSFIFSLCKTLSLQNPFKVQTQTFLPPPPWEPDVGGTTPTRGEGEGRVLREWSPASIFSWPSLTTEACSFSFLPPPAASASASSGPCRAADLSRSRAWNGLYFRRWPRSIFRSEISDPFFGSVVVVGSVFFSGRGWCSASMEWSWVRVWRACLQVGGWDWEFYV